MKVVNDGVLSPWKKIGEPDVKMDTPYMRAFVQKFQHPITDKEYAFSQIEIGNYVSIFPLTREGNIVLTDQWKQGTEMLCPQPPGGAVKEGEDIAEAARQKLLSETGYQAGAVEVVNTQFHFFDSRSKNYYNVALARDCEYVGRAASPDADVLRIFEVTPQEFWNMIAYGEIHEPAAYAGAILAQQRGLLKM